MSNSSEKVLEIAEKFGTSNVDFSQQGDNIQSLIKLVKTGDTKTKVLIAGLIPQHISNFGSFTSAAVDAQLDVCEDASVDVRIAGIRGMSRVITAVTEKAVVDRCIDAIVQLYVSAEDDGEVHALNHVVQMVTNAKPLQFCVLGLQLLPNQTDSARTKLFEALKGILNTRTVIKSAQYSEITAAVAEVIQSIHAQLTGPEYAYFASVLNRSGTNQEVLKNLTLTRSKIHEPLTVESLAAIAAHASALGKLAKDSDLLVQIYNTAFSSLAFANHEDEAVTGNVRTVINLAVIVSKFLTPRQCNAVFGPFYEAFLSVLGEPQTTYPYLIVCRLLTLFHVLAAPLKDTLRDITGLNAISIQPSTVSSEERAQRLTTLQTAVQNVITSLQVQIDAINANIPEHGFARNARYKSGLRIAARAEAKAAKVAAKAEEAAATKTDTSDVTAPVADEDDEVAIAAEAEKGALEDAAAEVAAAEQAADEHENNEEASGKKRNVVPFTAEEAAEFIKNVQARSALKAHLTAISELAQPIIKNHPQFLTNEQINAKNYNSNERRRKEAGKPHKDAKKSVRAPEERGNKKERHADSKQARLTKKGDSKQAAPRKGTTPPNKPGNGRQNNDREHRERDYRGKNDHKNAKNGAKKEHRENSGQNRNRNNKDKYKPKEKAQW